MQGRKTHEQQLRTLERKPDLPDQDQIDRELLKSEATAHIAHAEERQSEFAVSQHGLNQESDHNKHNLPDQTGHRPQHHGPAEEKH